ncbi:MAG: alpha/beta hydrolase, partial [Acidimicrobiales bacterium]
LYSAQSWTELDEALAALQRGDGEQILNIFDNYVERNPDGSYSNVLQAETAVNCLDLPSPTVAQLEADAAQVLQLAPTFGVADLLSEIQCAAWPVAATGKAAPLSAVGAPPILVVGTTGDPVTPYTWAQALAKELSSGVLLTREGLGHTAYGASSCIDSYVDAYLIKLRVPAPGIVCPSD